MKDLYTHTLLIVPNKQMEDFKFVMDLAPENVTLMIFPYCWYKSAGRQRRVLWH